MRRSPLRTRSLPVLLSAGMAAAASACSLFDADSGLDIDAGVTGDTGGTPGGGTTIGPDGLPLVGNSAGETCARGSDCRMNLVCGTSGTCEPSGEVQLGELCTISAECGEGLACSMNVADGTPSMECMAAGSATEDATCSSFSDCAPGLRCNLVGFTGLCEPDGTVDAGGTCASSADCLSPLGCSPAGTCQLPIFGGVNRIPPAVCEDVDASQPFRVFFEVPGDEPLPDFYRLPFPNDIRRSENGINMEGYHNPGLVYLGGELIQRYIDAVATMDGFSTNPTVFFRFSEAIDFGSISAGSETSTLVFVNVDPDSPNIGRGTSMNWYLTTGRGKFICDNYMAVRPAWGAPLEHDTTYAVYLTDGIRSSQGDTPTASSDFLATIATDRPADPRLAPAWDAFQPLRDYWTANSISTAHIIAATVFTTIDPDTDIPGIRTAVRSGTAPTLEEATLCGPGVISPCDDGAERRCVDAAGSFRQIHATYRAPIFQAGTRPYLTPEDGGALEFDVNGVAVVQGEEEICLSLTIPDGPMPETGWPVVMYSHGTGGSFISHIQDGTAARLSNIDLGGDAAPVQVASVGIDGVQHGPRRGNSDLDADTLFFNFTNPGTARGNVQQGAADGFVLQYMLENLVISASESPIGEEIRFDTSNIWYFGHSQGSTVGAPFVAWEPNVRGAIFSGAGASLTLSLLNKTSPVDIASAVQFVLNDGVVGDSHPFLSLLQMWIDPVDALNYGRLYFRAPPTDITPKHVFMSYGIGDSYSPEPTLLVFAQSMGVQQAPGAVTLDGPSTVEYPVSGNRSSGDSQVTGVVITYQPGDYDGHFVVFRNPDGERQSMEFLGSAIRNGIPTVSE